MSSRLLSPAIVWATLTNLIIMLSQRVSPIVTGDPAGYYSFVFNKALEGEILGINSDWVYPVAAQIPIFTAGLIGQLLGSYLLGWSLLVLLLNTAIIFILSKKFNLSHLNMAYASLLLIAISSIFYYRLDIIAIFLSLIAIMVYTKQKNLAYLLLVVGTLIKIWPIAIIFAIWLMSKNKIRDIVNVASFTVLVMSPALIIGGLSTALSFVSTQNSRGVQMESLFALPSLLKGEKAYYNQETFTYEVPLSGLEFMSSLSNLMLIGTLIAIISFGIIKFWKNPATLNQAFLLGSMIIIAFVLFNKVGSAQFAGWVLLVVFIMRVFLKDYYSKYYVIFGALFVIASGMLVPYLYGQLINGEAISIIFLAIKHMSLIIMLGIMSYALIVPKNKQDLAEKIN
jgi:general stress protein CsbA